MKIVEPVTIADSNFTASNIVEDIPLASSGTTYNKWAVGTAYTAGNVICHSYWTGHIGVGVQRFGVFTCLISATGVEPNPADNPGYWSLDSSADLYDAGTSYGIGILIGYIGATTGAYYSSKVAANVANTPPSSPTQWLQTTPDGFNTYAGGTSYALDAIVVVFTDQLAQIYKSLQAANIGHTPASSPTYWEYLGSTWRPWAIGTAYTTGMMVIDLRTHHSYLARSASTGKDPTDPDNSAYWQDLGTNNKWAWADLSNSSATICPTALDNTVQLPASCNTFALLNMRATSVQVIASTVAAGTLYNVTIDLTTSASKTASRLYYYDAETKEAHLALLDLPTNVDLIVRYIITNAGASSQLGVGLFGTYDEIGGVQFGLSMGIISRSKKEPDGFGNYSLLPRPSSLRPKYIVEVDTSNDNGDRVFFKFKRLDAVPAFYIGTDHRAASWAMGIYRSFEELLAYPTRSFYGVEIESI